MVWGAYYSPWCEIACVCVAIRNRCARGLAAGVALSSLSLPSDSELLSPAMQAFLNAVSAPDENRVVSSEASSSWRKTTRTTSDGRSHSSARLVRRAYSRLRRPYRSLRTACCCYASCVLRAGRRTCWHGRRAATMPRVSR